MSSEIFRLRRTANLSGEQSVTSPERQRQFVLGGIRRVTRKASQWLDGASFTSKKPTQLSKTELSRIAQIRTGLLEEVLQVKVDRNIIDLPPETTKPHS